MNIVVKGSENIKAVALAFFAIAQFKFTDLEITDIILIDEAKKACIKFIPGINMKKLKLTPIMIVLIDYYFDSIVNSLPQFECNVIRSIMSEMQKQKTNYSTNSNYLLLNGK